MWWEMWNFFGEKMLGQSSRFTRRLDLRGEGWIHDLFNTTRNLVGEISIGVTRVQCIWLYLYTYVQYVRVWSPVNYTSGADALLHAYVPPKFVSMH